MQQKEQISDYEKTIDPEYLHILNVSYDKWIANISDIPILTIDTNNFNIFKDRDRLNEIIEEIDGKIE